MLIYLAGAPEQRSTIAEVAAAFDISEHHVVKVVQFLGREGFLCFNADTNSCCLTGVCRMQRVLAEAMKAFYATLDHYTLEDLRIPAPKLAAALHFQPREAIHGRASCAASRPSPRAPANGSAPTAPCNARRASS